VTGIFWLNPLTSQTPDPGPTRGLRSNASKGATTLTPQIRPSTRHQIS
jgi:hypothetical protein